MPYRLRLYNGAQLLVATDHETPEGAGRQVAEFPVVDFVEFAEDGSGSGSIRRELVYLGEDGSERPATRDEDDAAFTASSERMSELMAERAPPCPRCGLKPADHAEPIYPVLATPEGPVYLACWTAEEKKRLPPGLIK